MPAPDPPDDFKTIGEQLIAGLNDLTEKLMRSKPVEVTLMRREQTPDGPMHTTEKAMLVADDFSPAKLAARLRATRTILIESNEDNSNDFEVVAKYATSRDCSECLRWCAARIAALEAELEKTNG